MSTISVSPVPGTTRPTPAAVDEVEAVLGFRPERSLAIRVRRRRAPSAVLRLDLPASLTPRTPRVRSGTESRGGRALEESDRFAHTVTGMVSQLSGARAVDVLVYQDQPYRPLGRFVYDIAERLHAAGFCLTGVYRVTARSWSPLVMTQLADGWQFVEQGERTRLPGFAVQPEGGQATSARASRAPERDPHHGPFVPITPPTQRRLARAMATVAALERRQSAPERELIDELLEWQNVLAPGAAAPGDARSIALAWSLRTATVRDCVLMLCAWGFEASIVSALDVTNVGSADATAGGLETVLGTGSAAPAPERVRRSIDVLRSVARCVPDSLSAPIFSILAWLEWSRGRGSAASGYLDAALTADTSYHLAQLLRQMIGAGRLPEWIR